MKFLRETNVKCSCLVHQVTVVKVSWKVPHAESIYFEKSIDSKRYIVFYWKKWDQDLAEKRNQQLKSPLSYIENSIGMGSFCDGSIIFFRSDYLVTDLVTIIIHRKRSLVFYKQSSQRDVEESTGLLQSDSKEKKNMDIFKACRSTGSPGMKVCCFKAILPLLYYS